MPLPLGYAREMATPRGIEPPASTFAKSLSSIELRGHEWIVRAVRVERTLDRLSTEFLCLLGYARKIGGPWGN